MNKEYKESLTILIELKNLISYKNSILINLFLNHLQLEEYDKVLDLVVEIDKTDNFMDYDEKNLKKMYLYARERLKVTDYAKYEDHLRKISNMRVSL